MKKQLQRYRGYTLIELLIAVFGIATLTGAAWAVYTLVHFIRKAW